MRKFTFRMYADIIFNRPIVRDKDYICPGGYTMVMNGKSYTFDFENYEGAVDEHNPKILHVVQKHPDYAEFDDLSNITEKDLKHVEKIEEFFVYTGEPGESNLRPVKVRGLGFEVIPEEGRIYNVCCSAVMPYACPQG